MSETSRYGGAVNNRLSLIAKRLRSLMQRNNINLTELAKRCDLLAHEIFPENECPNLTRERISKILMNAQSRVGKGAAKLISPQEIFILAETLNVSVEWLTGQTKTSAPILWDVASEPELVTNLLHLMGEYEERTGEMFLWGENLLCSLTPPEFAHGYHEAHFAELDKIGLQREKHILVTTYDLVGDIRRARTFGDTSKRSWTITQVIFLSELQKIIKGEGEYSNINHPTRQNCLENLVKILDDDSLGVSLIVTRDEDAPFLKKLLLDCDRFGVNGEKFSLWGYHSGKIAWSENKDLVKRNRKIITELVDRSAFRERKDVLDLLSQLLEIMEKKSK